MLCIGAQAPQPLAGKWQLVQQGVDVSLGLIGREQTSGEEPWPVPGLLLPLLLAAHTPLTLPSLGHGSGENWDMGCVTAQLDSGTAVSPNAALLGQGVLLPSIGQQSFGSFSCSSTPEAFGSSVSHLYVPFNCWRFP